MEPYLYASGLVLVLTGSIVGYQWALRGDKSIATVIVAAAIGAGAPGAVIAGLLGVSGMGMAPLWMPFQAGAVGATIGACGLGARALGGWLQRRP